MSDEQKRKKEGLLPLSQPPFHFLSRPHLWYIKMSILPLTHHLSEFAELSLVEDIQACKYTLK